MVYVDGGDLNVTRIEVQCSGDAAAKEVPLDKLEH